MALSIGDMLCSSVDSATDGDEEALAEGALEDAIDSGGEAIAMEDKGVLGPGSTGCSTRPPPGASSLDEQEMAHAQVSASKSPRD
jgi:hypothetical protein